jgi:hypothetical protein
MGVCAVLSVSATRIVPPWTTRTKVAVAKDFDKRAQPPRVNGITLGGIAKWLGVEALKPRLALPARFVYTDSCLAADGVAPAKLWVVAEPAGIGGLTRGVASSEKASGKNDGKQ